MKQFQLEAHGLSDVGPIRRNNEDVWASLLEHRFFAVADGMGGHKAGEIAAKEATRLLCEYAQDLLFISSKERLTKKKIMSHLEKSFSHANNHVFKLGENHQDLKGMGTTLCCLYFYRSIAIFAHVGDSRIYRFRKNKLKLLTKDHSLENKLTKKKLLKRNQSLPPPYKNVITRAIGTMAKVTTDTSFAHVKEGDLFLMCTDGLSDFVKKKYIENILLSSHPLSRKSKSLIQEAKKMGSCDNITALLICVKKSYESDDLLGQQCHYIC